MKVFFKRVIVQELVKTFSRSWILFFTIFNAQFGYAVLYVLDQDGGQLSESSDTSYLDQSCTLCLGSFDGDEKVIGAHCDHYFHDRCFRTQYRCCCYGSNCGSSCGNICACSSDIEALIQAVYEDLKTIDLRTQAAIKDAEDAGLEVRIKHPPNSEVISFEASSRQGHIALKNYEQHKDEPGSSEHLKNAVFHLIQAYRFGGYKMRDQVLPCLVQAIKYTISNSFTHFQQGEDPYNYHRDILEVLFSFVHQSKYALGGLGLSKATSDEGNPYSSNTSAASTQDDFPFTPMLTAIEWSIGIEAFENYKRTTNPGQLERAINYFERCIVNTDTGQSSQKNLLKIYAEAMLEYGALRRRSYQSSMLPGCLPIQRLPVVYQTHVEVSSASFSIGSSASKPFRPLRSDRPGLPSDLYSAEKFFKDLSTDATIKGMAESEQASTFYAECQVLQAEEELKELYTGDEPAGLPLYRARRFLETTYRHVSTGAVRKKADYLKNIIDGLSHKQQHTSSSTDQLSSQLLPHVSGGLSYGATKSSFN